VAVDQLVKKLEAGKSTPFYWATAAQGEQPLTLSIRLPGHEWSGGIPIDVLQASRCN
jgi:hypothetical protein